MNNIIGLSLVFCAICFSTVYAQNSFEDLKQVKKTIQYYFDGATNADITKLEKAFHKVSVLRWIADGILNEKPRDEWFEWIKANGPFERENSIESVNITGNAASVKVMCSLPNVQYVDYLSLLKISGEWKIVAKIFEKIDK